MSAQSGRTRTNIETAAKLTRISETIRITSREDYEAARALRQWAVDLDRHNAAALADLTFAIVTGVLNHWSSDEVADLHAADLALQDALLIAPGSMSVRARSVPILRGMRQFEAAVKHAANLLRASPSTRFSTRKSDMTS